MKNIIVAIAFDQKELVLIDHAEKYARAEGAKVWIIHCAAPDPEFVSLKISSEYERNTRADELREEHRFIQELADGLNDKGVEAESLLIQGPAVETILEKSAELKADLIISGLHEHGLMYNVIIGNTALGLLKNAKIPVLTVPVDYA